MNEWDEPKITEIKLEVADHVICDQRDVSQTFNKYLISVPKTTVMDGQNHVTLNNINEIQTQFGPANCTHSFFFSPVIDNEVKGLISQLSASNSPGIYLISPFVKNVSNLVQLTRLEHCC